MEGKHFSSAVFSGKEKEQQKISSPCLQIVQKVTIIEAVLPFLNPGRKNVQRYFHGLTK